MQIIVELNWVYSGTYMIKSGRAVKDVRDFFKRKQDHEGNLYWERIEPDEKLLQELKAELLIALPKNTFEFYKKRSD